MSHLFVAFLSVCAGGGYFSNDVQSFPSLTPALQGTPYNRRTFVRFFFRVVETMDTAEGIKVNAPLCGHADLQKYPFPFPPPVFFFLNRWASSAV